MGAVRKGSGLHPLIYNQNPKTPIIMEQEIIQPIAKEILKSELTPDRQLRMTNKSHNEIYVVTAHNAPNVMKEIGRLREIAFREAGGGTGKSMDIDEFDTCEN